MRLASATLFLVAIVCSVLLDVITASASESSRGPNERIKRRQYLDDTNDLHPHYKACKTYNRRLPKAALSASGDKEYYSDDSFGFRHYEFTDSSRHKIDTNYGWFYTVETWIEKTKDKKDVQVTFGVISNHWSYAHYQNAVKIDGYTSLKSGGGLGGYVPFHHTFWLNRGDTCAFPIQRQDDEGVHIDNLAVFFITKN